MENIDECNAFMLQAIESYRAALRAVQTKYTAALEQRNPGPDTALQLAMKKLNAEHQYFMRISECAMPTINEQIKNLLTDHNANPVDPDAIEPVPVAVTMKENISSIMQALENYEVALKAAETEYNNALAQQAEGPITFIEFALYNLNQAHAQFMSVSEVAMCTINAILIIANLVKSNAVEPEPIGSDVIDGSEEHNREHAGARLKEEVEQDVVVPKETGEHNEDNDLTGAEAEQHNTATPEGTMKHNSDLPDLGSK